MVVSAGGHHGRTGDYPEALVKILITLIERTPAGGATLEDLQEAYREVRDRTPCKKTIDRAVRRLNLLFDPLAYDEDPDDPDDPCDAGDGLEGVAPPRAIRCERRDGRVRYRFTRELASRPVDAGTVLVTALSLYPQRRGLLAGQFEAVVKPLLEDLLGRLAAWRDLVREMEEHVFVSGFGPAEPRRTLRAIDQTLRAIRHGKRVRFEYVRSYDGARVTREVEPFGLVCRFHRWYLVGLCRERGERRVFLLDNVRRLEVVENSVSRVPAGFSLREAYGRAWGVWTEAEPGEPETVRLRAGKGLAERFRSTRFHDSQAVRDLPGGAAEVTFAVTGAHEMVPWLMSWGAAVEVLEPAWLREAIVESLMDTLEVYRREGTGEG